jgi:hypothetical protein
MLALFVTVTTVSKDFRDLHAFAPSSQLQGVGAGMVIGHHEPNSGRFRLLVVLSLFVSSPTWVLEVPKLSFPRAVFCMADDSITPICR